MPRRYGLRSHMCVMCETWVTHVRCVIQGDSKDPDTFVFLHVISSKSLGVKKQMLVTDSRKRMRGFMGTIPKTICSICVQGLFESSRICHMSVRRQKKKVYIHQPFFLKHMPALDNVMWTKTNKKLYLWSSIADNRSRQRPPCI
jgi:hypothetical protein